MENERNSPVNFESIKYGEAKRFDDDMAEEDVPIIEKRNRRRSSVFAEVRNNLIDSMKANESNPYVEERSLKEAQIKTYAGELREEKRVWLDVTKKRKGDYEAAYKKYNDHCKKRQVMAEKECLPYLDEVDVKYLRDLPNFKLITTKYCKLWKIQKILEEQRRTNINIVSTLLNLIRQDAEAEKQNIRKYSEIQPI